MGKAEPGNGWEKGEDSLKRDRIPVQWSRAGCARGQRSKLKYLLTPKARRRKKLCSPREQRCHHVWGLALLLVTVLLPLPCLGLAMWVLCTAGETSQTTQVGCRITPLAAQHLSPGCPKRFPAILPASLGVPVPSGAVWWQLAEPWRTWLHGGVTVGTPIPTELPPFGWAGWTLPTCLSPPGYRGTVHPTQACTPWGLEGLPTMSLLPNPAWSALETPRRVQPRERGLTQGMACPGVAVGCPGGTVHCAVPGCVCGLLEAAWRTPLSAGAPGSPAAWHTGRAFFLSLFFFFLFYLGKKAIENKKIKQKKSLRKIISYLKFSSATITAWGKSSGWFYFISMAYFFFQLPSCPCSCSAEETR